jgi:hypothetical protein
VESREHWAARLLNFPHCKLGDVSGTVCSLQFERYDMTAAVLAGRRRFDNDTFLPFVSPGLARRSSRGRAPIP